MASRRTLEVVNSVHVIELSAEDYQNPGKLMDEMVMDQDVCRTGVFVGRLGEGVKPTDADIIANINRVKKAVKKDALNPSTRRPFFDPTLQRRAFIREQENVFRITPCCNELSDGRAVRTLRRQFKEDLAKETFMGDRKTELELALDSGGGGVSGALDALISSLSEKNLQILYVTSMKLEEDLETTADLSMDTMDSYIKHMAPCDGITSPTVFIGRQCTTFNMHIEDCAFESVNRHIAGAPKVWFIIPPRFYNALCNLISKMGATLEERNCANYMSHNDLFIDPRTLVSYGIPVFSVVQRPGDVLYLLPFTVHYGFNCGWNLNEAQNFASSSWAKSGMVAPLPCVCNCVQGEDRTFDITPVLRAIGVSEEIINDFEEGWLVNIKNDVSNLLDPESGLPFSTSIHMQDLFGIEYADIEVPKLVVIRPLQRKQGYHNRSMWGGYELICLDSEDDESEIDEDEVEEVVKNENKAVVLDRFKCQAASCYYYASGRGNTASTRLQNHVLRNHSSSSQELLQKHREQYKRSIREPKTNPDFVCDNCGKQLRGNKFHKRRHEESCARTGCSGP